MIDIRYPHIVGRTPQEQISEMKNYLYQLVDQLQFMTNSSGGNAQGTVQSPVSVRVSAPSGANAQVSQVSFEDVISAGEAWLSLGLSANVTESESSCGRWENTGCHYRVCADGKHVYVAFNCAFAYGGSPLQVNADAIPSAYRPKRNVYAMCATDGRAVARVLVNKNGNILVDWIQVLSSAEQTTSSTVKWIDGYIDYWL